MEQYYYGPLEMKRFLNPLIVFLPPVLILMLNSVAKNYYIQLDSKGFHVIDLMMYFRAL